MSGVKGQGRADDGVFGDVFDDLSWLEVRFSIVDIQNFQAQSENLQEPSEYEAPA